MTAAYSLITNEGDYNASHQSLDACSIWSIFEEIRFQVAQVSACNSTTVALLKSCLHPQSRQSRVKCPKGVDSRDRLCSPTLSLTQRPVRLTEHSVSLTSVSTGHLTLHCQYYGCRPDLGNMTVPKWYRDKQTREMFEALWMVKTGNDSCISWPSISR